MKVVMLVNISKYREGKVVEIIQAANDWVRTKKEHICKRTSFEESEEIQ